jgi:hypothetical protein
MARIKAKDKNGISYELNFNSLEEAKHFNPSFSDFEYIL